MTRINVGIPPANLSNKHLLAEHREIKRLPNHLAKHGPPSNVPAEFKLGTGHVKFMIMHGAYTLRRYLAIYIQCKRRGFNVSNYSEAWNIYKQYPELYNDYLERACDRTMIETRISTNDKRSKARNKQAA